MTAASSPDRIASPPVAKPKLWKEALIVLALYWVYSAARNVHGATISVSRAMSHAHDVVNAERALHIFHELDIQRYFLAWPPVIKFFNVWYGTAHFVVTIGVLVWMFRRRASRYTYWRNVIMITTLLALVGYIVYPLTPPRLLDPHFGFEDTLKTIGGLWNFESGAVAKASNQHAAMPSLHVGWAVWCAIATVSLLQNVWLKVLMSIYPFVTILTIVATANHYWLDVAGGLFILGLGLSIASMWEARNTLKDVIGTNDDGRT